jgi:nucleoid-associated protein YgaU
MFEEFRNEKQDQQQSALDPLSEKNSLPLSKKVVILCSAVALIGLCIFFTSESWGGSDNKHEHHSKSKQNLSEEIEQIKTRLSDLEQKLLPPTSAPLSTTPTLLTEVTAPQPQESEAAAVDLQALIEQELQESAATTPDSAKETEVAMQDSKAVSQSKKKTTTTTAKKQTYTVQKGDSLSKISQKFYGSTKKWKKIVDANKDKLGHSQVLKPGMKLTIPSEEG